MWKIMQIEADNSLRDLHNSSHHGIKPKQPCFQANITPINLVSNQVYQRIDVILLVSSKVSQRRFVMKN